MELLLRFEAKSRHIILTIAFIALASSRAGFVGTSTDLTVLPPVSGLVIGPIQFVNIYFLAGQDSERRFPRVGEEFVVKAEIRNIGAAAIYYLPTLCDSSLSAVFDPSFVRVESGRPRCLAASIVTPLNPGEETTVWGPESGTVYVAIRSGSTTVTAIFNYNTDAGMNSSTQAQAQSTVPLTIEKGTASLPIPGFSIESLVLGLILSLGILIYRRRTNTNQH